MIFELLFTMVAMTRVQQSDSKAIEPLVIQSWQSLSGFEIEAEEPLGDDPTKASLNYSVQYKSDREWNVSVSGINSDGSLSKTRTMQDGKYLTTASLTDRAGEIRTLQILALEGPPQQYACPNTILMMLLMPGGKSVVQLLAVASKTEVIEVDKKIQKLRLSIPHQGQTMICELEEKYDWLPSLVSISDGYFIFRVTKFGRDNSRWFPVEGEYEQLKTRPGELPLRRFRVTSLRVNRPPSANTWTKIEPTEGTSVEDTIAKKNYTHTKNKTKAPGRVSTAKAGNEVSEDAIVVERPSPSLAPWIAFTSGIVCLLLAGGIFIIHRVKTLSQ